jgi:uncharacterized protein YcnI
MRKILASLSIALVTVLGMPGVAFAHVVVTPAQAGVGSKTLFNVSVPNEKTVPITSLRLTIPGGLEEVTPSVHTGWTISTSGGTAKHITEIRWEGGAIPSGQRDDFTFQAQVPAKETTLDWKAYQTYADGSTVAWDQKPGSNHGENETDTSGPYSVTAIKNDLNSDNNSSTASTNRSLTWAFTISLIALVLSVIALIKRRT